MIEVLRWLRAACRRVVHLGTARRCPLCRAAVRRFLRHGPDRRPDARCPVCGSLERHRFAWWFLTRHTPLAAGGRLRLLHVAPERPLAGALRRVRGVERITADLRAPDAMVHADLTALPFGDGRFDEVFCSHVLEHVADDAAAMREMRRVLRPGGQAWILVPTHGRPTDEDPAAPPADRAARFGQEDHVRIYGLDVVHRLEAAGFDVAVCRAADAIEPHSRERIGVPGHELLFRCRRPTAVSPPPAAHCSAGTTKPAWQCLASSAWSSGT